MREDVREALVLEREEMARRSPTMIGDQKVPDRAMGKFDHGQYKSRWGKWRWYLWLII